MSGSSQNPFVSSSSSSSSSSKRLGEAVEKSNFAHTCNLLSQYVKERGTLRDLNLAGIGGISKAIAKPQESKATTTTLNLLNKMQNLDQPSSHRGKSVDPFSRLAASVTSGTSDDAMRKASRLSKEETVSEPKRAQMTLFYAGEVIVFEDCSAEKAKEIMHLASSGRSGNANVNGSQKITPSNNVDKLCFGEAVASNSKAPAKSVSISAQELPQQPQLEANNTSELPIARRSSLHRFLAKRKDRAGARAPYQLHNNNNDNNDRPESSSQNDQEQLDLKL